MNLTEANEILQRLNTSLNDEDNRDIYRSWPICRNVVDDTRSPQLS